MDPGLFNDALLAPAFVFRIILQNCVQWPWKH